MVHSILAIDLGSETITAAVATAHAEPEPAVLYLGDEPAVGAHVFVDGGDELQPATFRGSSQVKITGIASSLGKPPRVIAGAPRAGNSLAAVAVAPLIARAEHYFRGSLDVIAATYPAQWTAAMLDDFSRALARYADAVTLIPWAEAVAAQTSFGDGDRPVVSLDFGSSAATVTVVGAADGRPSVEFTSSDPSGGSRALDRHIAQVVADSTRLDTSTVDRRWWAAAAAEAGRVRIAAVDTASVLATFPDPIGSITLTSDDVHQVAGRHMQDAVRTLVARAPRTSGQRVELTGGLALDRSLQAAVRSVIGPATVVPDPAHAAAYGAAALAARTAAAAPQPRSARTSRWGIRR